MAKQKLSVATWLSSILNSEIRDRAISNFKLYNTQERMSRKEGRVDLPINAKVSSIEEALAYAFSWEKTREGYAYWSSVRHSLVKQGRDLDCYDPLKVKERARNNRGSRGSRAVREQATTKKRRRILDL